MTFGILSCGAYIPRKRLSRAALFEAVGWAQPALKSLATGARAFGAWDEDAITMSVEAARMATQGRGEKICTKINNLCFASTTAPFIDRQNAGIVASALDLAGSTHCFDMGGGQRAGLSALIKAVQTGCNQNDLHSTTLVVAGERRPTKSASALEMLSGDGAAAILVGHGDPIAEIHAIETISSDFVDHYRTVASQVDYVLEERWFREAGLAKIVPKVVAPLLERAGLDVDQINHLIVPLPNPSMSGAIATMIGVEKSQLADGLYTHCGYTGVAHPLLMLAQTLANAKPDDWILCLAFGQGCDAMLLRATDHAPQASSPAFAIPDESRWENNYIRFLSANRTLEMDWGMRAERDNRTAQTVAFNKSRDIYGFVGGYCSACKTPQFPKARRCVNPDCAALDTQTEYRFAERQATIKSFTEDWLAFTREPPLIYGNVSFEGGGNVFMEMTDFAPGEAAIGTALRMAFRIKDIDTTRGFHRYFWKAAQIDGGAHG